MTKVLVLQHVPAETLGNIAEALGSRGIEVEVVETFAGGRVPRTTGGFSGLVVLGGPMGVYELAKYPFLRDELGLLGEALRADKPILGVCLGSQLLAAVLGAEVKKGPQKEIGWHEVRLSPDAATDPLFAGVARELTPLHWHGDQFALPRGATGLASSTVTPCQAFRHGQVAYGILFHLETTPIILEGMVSAFSDELGEERILPALIRSDAEKRLGDVRALAATVFGRWADLVVAFPASEVGMPSSRRR